MARRLHGLVRGAEALPLGNAKGVGSGKSCRTSLWGGWAVRERPNVMGVQNLASGRALWLRIRAKLGAGPARGHAEQGGVEQVFFYRSIAAELGLESCSRLTARASVTRSTRV